MLADLCVVNNTVRYTKLEIELLDPVYSFLSKLYFILVLTTEIHVISFTKIKKPCILLDKNSYCNQEQLYKCNHYRHRHMVFCHVPGSGQYCECTYFRIILCMYLIQELMSIPIHSTFLQLKNYC